jgi:very-short-patch-repair endonuclease
MCRAQPWRTNRARVLRSKASSAEERLWTELRARRLNGLKFVRQYPIGPYFVDFACRELKIIVEVDGGTHSTADEQARDTVPPLVRPVDEALLREGITRAGLAWRLRASKESYRPAADERVQHSAGRYNAARAGYLESNGFRVFRAHNQEVYDNLDGVLETLLAFIEGKIE